MANNTMELSKGVMLGVIVILIILLFMFVPGLRNLFTMDKDNPNKSGGSVPVNVKVNGETVRSTTSGSSKETGKDSTVNVDVKDTKDGTSINITVPDEVNVDAQGAPSTSVSPLPGL